MLIMLYDYHHDDDDDDDDADGDHDDETSSGWGSQTSKFGARLESGIREAANYILMMMLMMMMKMMIMMILMIMLLMTIEILPWHLLKVFELSLDRFTGDFHPI